MNKILIVTLVSTLATLAFAGTGYIANDRIDQMLIGELEFTKAEATDLAVSDDVTVGGTLEVTGVASFTAVPAFNATIAAAPTNTVAAGLTITIDGTNYILAVYPN